MFLRTLLTSNPTFYSNLRRINTSWWANVSEGPPDPILGLNVAFREDKNPAKVNLGVGAYRTDDGKPFILSCVTEAERRIQGMDHEYAPISGLPGFVSSGIALALGADSPVISKGQIAATQVLSGTGALRVAADYIARFRGKETPVYFSSPTWPNHYNVFKDAGLCDQRPYRYFDGASKGLDFDGMFADISAAPAGSVVVLHACAHNPTGVDPSQQQWQRLSQMIGDKGLFPFFDFAYQGFASGDAERDAFAVREFLKDGHQIALCQSFAKNFGLYGERAGVLSFTTRDAEETKRMMSQLLILIRPMYSNPPLTGARLVSTILGDAKLRALWEQEVKLMADRIIGMRTALATKLREKGSVLPWKHITDQIGMFCYTGLTAAQCELLIKQYSIYLTKNGRISIAGLTSHNVDYVASAIHEVTK